jgi:hypothetical protein
MVLLCLITSCSVFNTQEKPEKDIAEFIDDIISTPDSTYSIIKNSKLYHHKYSYLRNSCSFKSAVEYIKEYIKKPYIFYDDESFTHSGNSNSDGEYILRIIIIKSVLNDRYFAFEFRKENDRWYYYQWKLGIPTFMY